MIYSRLLAALPFCLVVAVNGFSTETVAFRPSAMKSTSTCLHAEDAKAASSADDILNSPAFLTRKLEVLKSDSQKIDEEYKAAKAAVEEGKAEWGKQLDDLEIEVRFTCHLGGKSAKSIV
jgi:hypothetical protein